MGDYLKGEGFQIRKKNRLYFRLISATFLTAFAIFAILPITQWISGDPRDQYMVRSVDLSLPPPPPPPPEPPRPPEEEVKQEQPELEQPPQQLDLSQLEAALNPGTGGAMGNFQLEGFSVAPDVSGELMIFSIADLDSRPKRRKAISPIIPQLFQASGPKGIVRVRIMIDEKGSVTIMEIVEATHDEVVQPVRQALVKWRFDPPKKDGKVVKAQYIQPFPYDYSK